VGHPLRISHSDAGSQYTSIRFTEHLALEGIKPSVGTVGDAFDKALMETIIGLFKTECISTTIFHPGPFRTLADVEFAVAGGVDWYQPPPAALQSRRGPTGRDRASPLRCRQPRRQHQMWTAKNPNQFHHPAHRLPRSTPTSRAEPTHRVLQLNPCCA
jgi:transposase InsO family protein